MIENFDIYFNDESYTDLNPLFIGHQKCEENHGFGPRICPYTIIHYILAGKGVLEKNGTIYQVQKGELFIIMADEIARYTADSDDPWEYVWIAFDGIFSDKLKKAESCVLSLKESIFEELLYKCQSGTCDKSYVTSILYKLNSIFLKNDKGESVHDYPAEAKKIIQLKYMQQISVEQISRTLNIDKRYLSRIFKKKYGKTVIEYLVNIRISKACELLKQGYNVGDCAKIVGYTDTFNFSKMFKKRTGLSPKDYKQKYTQL